MKNLLLLFLLLALSSLSYSQSDDTTNVISVEENNCGFSIVDEAPIFPGGVEGIKKFIKENKKYPKELKDKNISGRVFVGFKIDSLGNVLEPKILKGIHPIIDNEALRIIKIMPKWKPAKHKGKNVSLMFQLPINF